MVAPFFQHKNSSPIFVNFDRMYLYTWRSILKCLYHSFRDANFIEWLWKKYKTWNNYLTLF